MVTGGSRTSRELGATSRDSSLERLGCRRLRLGSASSVVAAAVAPSRRACPSPRRGAAQEARDLVERALRGRQADALQRPSRRCARGARATAPGARRAWWAPARGSRRRSRCRPSAAARARSRSAAGTATPGVVIRMSAGSRWKRARSLAGVSPVRIAIGRHVMRDAPRGGHVRDAGERRAQVALDVHRQRLERRDVEHAAARVARRRRGANISAIEARQERRQRLAAAGRREDQRGLAARDRRPALRLRPRRRVERLGEPLARRRDGRA